MWPGQSGSMDAVRLEHTAPGVGGSALDETSPSPAEAFSALAGRVVSYLGARTPISSWSVNRVDHDVQVHLHVDGDLLTTGEEVPWDESICRRVVEGDVDPVVPDLPGDPVLGRTPWAERVGSYAGRPILDADGELFGMLCGVDADPLGPDEDVDVELLDLFASLLSAQATLARRATAQAEQAAVADAATDVRTGLLTSQAWDELLVAALTRARAFGDLSAVIVVDASIAQAPLTSAALHRAADATAAAAGADESVTYLGDGLLASLLDEATPSSLAGAVRAHRDALTARGFEATIGWSLVSPADEVADVVLQRALSSLREARGATGNGLVG